MPATIEAVRSGFYSFGSRHESRSVKWITCIVRAEKLDLIVESLNKLNLVGGMTVTDVRGGGAEKPFQGVKYVAPFVPRIKIELAIEASDVEDVGKLVSELARTGEVGDGKIFIFKVTDLMRIRTGERGTSAL